MSAQLKNEEELNEISDINNKSNKKKNYNNINVPWDDGNRDRNIDILEDIDRPMPVNKLKSTDSEYNTDGRGFGWRKDLYWDEVTGRNKRNST